MIASEAEMEFAHCDLAVIVGTVSEGRDSGDANGAPGGRSLVALVRSATLDPVRSILEFRAEALRAHRASATADEFAARQLRARAMRYARAAVLIEVRCAACAAPCAITSFDQDPGIIEAGIAPEPPPAP